MKAETWPPSVSSLSDITAIIIIFVDGAYTSLLTSHTPFALNASSQVPAEDQYNM